MSVRLVTFATLPTRAEHASDGIVQQVLRSAPTCRSQLDVWLVRLQQNIGGEERYSPWLHKMASYLPFCNLLGVTHPLLNISVYCPIKTNSSRQYVRSCKTWCLECWTLMSAIKFPHHRVASLELRYVVMMVNMPYRHSSYLGLCCNDGKHAIPSHVQFLSRILPRLYLLVYRAVINFHIRYTSIEVRKSICLL
jgi:hypothetical protein